MHQKIKNKLKMEYSCHTHAGGAWHLKPDTTLCSNDLQNMPTGLYICFLFTVYSSIFSHWIQLLQKVHIQ